MSRAGAIWVKLCGTTNLADAQLCVDAGANAIGFIFTPSARQIGVAAAAEIVSALGGEVEAIGVFVNQSPAQVAKIAGEVGLSGVQLHGDERASEMGEFRRQLGQRKIIKGLSFNRLTGTGDPALEEYLNARESIDAILLDSGSAEQRGGTGIPFDWERAAPIAAKIREQMPLIVAGGLNAEDVAQSIDIFQPWGVDVASGVESAPGKKDEAKVRAFLAAVRKHG